MSDLAPLVGEPLALDLVNTRSAAGDLLASPGDLLAWWELEADRLPEAAPAEAGAGDLTAVREVRERVARALGHVLRGERPPSADLEALNRAQRASPAIDEAVWDGEAVTVVRRRDGSPGLRLAACLAEAAARLLADPAVTAIRTCEADDCVMLFLPTHPRRRWCSPTRCGNRVRVARHYQRHKTQ
ncbi:CGNR zinc finger domain-containing protein [Streptomyces sp. NPDC005811]|uniref:CGNR zinc finger domain-containing protein n=1 Tax=Streptomyces sp. NPDC005811 TaxID=3154565 RepID=UPI0033C6E88F